MNTPASHYEAYMTFAEPQPNPWRREVIGSYLHHLDAADAQVTQLDIESIQLCYDQSPSYRYYHGPNHGEFVGQPDVPPVLQAQLSPRTPRQQAQAILAVAGLFHDVAYKHVDVLPDGSRVWPAVLSDRISDFARYSVHTNAVGAKVFTTTLTETGYSDPATQMVAHIFGMSDQGLAHNQGGNEFDSALTAAKFLQEKSVPERHIVAVVTAIAATVPFKPAIGIESGGSLTDGHMGDLAGRVKSVGLKLAANIYQPDWIDVNDYMLMAVHLANRDISPFIRQDNFPQIIHGGRAVKAEEIPELRPAGAATIRALARAAGLGRSAALLYQGLDSGTTPVPAANVPHIYIPRDTNGEPLGIGHAYPPYEVYQTAVSYTERNARLATLFFQAHEAGIVTAASVAALIGEPDAAVPGIVYAQRWSPDAMPRGETFHQLTADEQLVYAELMHGAHQTNIGIATPQRSPIGGLILGAAGQERTAALSRRIKAIRDTKAAAGNIDAFSHPQAAENYLHELNATIGRDNLATIIGELRRVARYFRDDPERGAPDREARIASIAARFLQT